MQKSYSRLWEGYETDADARKARDAEYRTLRASGTECRRWTLANQLKKYDGFGRPNGASCTVYYITVY